MAFGLAFASIPEGGDLYLVNSAPALARTIASPGIDANFGVGLALTPDGTLWGLYDHTDTAAGAVTGPSTLRQYDLATGTLITESALTIVAGTRGWLRTFHALPSGHFVTLLRETGAVIRITPLGTFPQTYGLTLVGPSEFTLSPDGSTLYYLEPYVGGSPEPIRRRLLPYRLDRDLPGGTWGTNLVSNGTFAGSAANWTLGVGWAYGNHAVTHALGVESAISQAIPALTLGTTYILTLTIRSTSGVVRLWVGRGDSQANYLDVPSTLGVDRTVYLAMTAVGAAIDGLFASASADADATISLVRVQPMTAGAAVIEADAIRPVTLSATQFVYASQANDLLVTLPLTGGTPAGAITFAGVNNAVTRDGSFIDITQPWTVAMWVHPNAMAPTDIIGLWRRRDPATHHYIQLIIDPTGDSGNPGIVLSYDTGAGDTVIGVYPITFESIYVAVAFGSGFLALDVDVDSFYIDAPVDLSGESGMVDEQIGGFGFRDAADVHGADISHVASWQEDMTAGSALLSPQRLTATPVARDSLLAFTPLSSPSLLTDTWPPFAHGWTAEGTLTPAAGPPIGDLTLFLGGDFVNDAEEVYGLAGDLVQNRLWMVYDDDDTFLGDGLGVVAWDIPSVTQISQGAVVEIVDYDIGGAVVGLLPFPPPAVGCVLDFPVE